MQTTTAPRDSMAEEKTPEVPAKSEVNEASADTTAASLAEARERMGDDSSSEEGEEGGDKIQASKVLAYWNSQEASVDGVLGGYGHLHEIDIKSSGRFLDLVTRKVKRWTKGLTPAPPHAAADVGCGIGRVTQHLLLSRFDFVWMLEPSEKMRNAIALASNPKVLVGDASLEYFARTGRLAHTCVQPEENSHKDPLALSCKKSLFDCIWLQWVCMYLDDAKLAGVLRALGQLLTPRLGVIFVKDNLAGSANERDSADHSVVRAFNCWKSIFAEAGLDIVTSQEQPHWPRNLHTVVMFALQPASFKPDNLP